MEEQAIVKIEVSIDGANLILTALAERAEKLERGALKTSNAFYAEFAAERSRKYEAIHNEILRQLVDKELEPVGELIERTITQALTGAAVPAT